MGGTSRRGVQTPVAEAEAESTGGGSAAPQTEGSPADDQQLSQRLSAMEQSIQSQAESFQAQTSVLARLLDFLERNNAAPTSSAQQSAPQPAQQAAPQTAQPPQRPLPPYLQQSPRLQQSLFEQQAGTQDTGAPAIVGAEVGAVLSAARKPTIKPDNIGQFDGSPDRLEFFRSRVEALIQSRSDPGWEQAVIEALPLCLRDTAAQWYQLMGYSQRNGLNTGWRAWERALRSAFQPDDGEARRLADGRKWVYQSETIQQYFYNKLALLRSAYPLRGESDLAQEIRLGLPDTLRLLVRSHLNRDVKINDLLMELKSLEESWRSAHRQPLRNASATTSSFRAPVTSFAEDSRLAPAVTSSSSTRANPPRSSPRPVTQPSGVSVANDYRPENISFVERDGKNTRAYKLPHSGRMIYLGRSCSKCGKPHFDFEHDHLAPQVKTESYFAQAELELIRAYGYPMFDAEPIVVEDDEDVTASPDLSYSSSTGGSTACESDNSLDNATAHLSGGGPDREVSKLDTSHPDGKDHDPKASVLSIDPGLWTLSVEKKVRRSNPLAVDVEMPCAQATGSGRAFKGHFPTTAFVSVHGTEPRLSLLDTGSSLSVIDESVARQLGLGPLNESKIEINGIGNGRSLGFITLAFSIQGRRGDEPIRLCSTADFHVLKDFSPGLCLGLDVIHSSGMVIDVQAGRAWVQEVSFPVFDIRGNKLSPKKVNKTVLVKEDTTVPEWSHTWVAVQHDITDNISYTLDNAAWLTADSETRVAAPAAVLDQHTTHVLITNLGQRPHVLNAKDQVGEAVPLGPDDLASPTGQFHMHASERTTPQDNVASAFPATESTKSTAEPLDFSDDELARPRYDTKSTVKVDDLFEVGLDETGRPHPTVVTLLRRHTAAFSLDGRPGRVSGVAMKIPLQESETLKPEAPRCVSPEKRHVIEETLDQLTDWDVIEPSSSSVSYPVLLVRQGHKWRFCVDYRGLNAATVPDRYPLPRIDDVFEALASNKYFSGLDAIRGYHQLDIAPEDRWKTAFVCHKGLYQYKQIPFGLRNAPAFFQRFMDQLLGHMRWTEALVYLDNVVVFSPTLEQHVRSLDKLLTAAERVGLKFSPAKCHFAISSLSLLGRQVSTEGISIQHDRAAAVQELAPPQTLQQLYHVLGLFNYYRDFIPAYAAKAAPLTSLLKGHKYRKFGDKWHLVDQNDLKTSANQVKLAWSREQDEAFQTLKDALSSPPTLAYPDYSRPFYLYIDASSQSFAAALHQRLPPPSLDQAGCHATADASTILDRQRRDPALKPIITALERGESRLGYEIQDQTLVYVGPKRTLRQLCVPAAEMKDLFSEHHDSGHFGFAKTYERLRQYHHPRLAAQLQAYIDNCPACLRTKLDRRTGDHSIARALQASYPFHTISVDVILGLPDCQGCNAALVVVDLFSRMLVTRACTSRATAVDLYDMLADMVLQRGFKPEVIVSDSDTRFIGQVGQQFADAIGATLQPSAPYHQQANPVERHIQTLQRVLRTLAIDHPEDWVTYLPAAELAINQTPSVATGEAPFDLVYITKVGKSVLPSVSAQSHTDRLAIAKARVETAWQKALNSASTDQRTFNRRHRPLHKVKEGDLVFVRLRDRPLPTTTRFPKLDPAKAGPFAVAEVLSDHRVRLSLPPDVDINPIFDVSQLDMAPAEPDPFGRPLRATPIGNTDQPAEDQEYEVERIVDERRRYGHLQYRVKWKDDPRLTWEFADDLADGNCDEVITEWRLRNVTTPPPAEHHHASAEDDELVERPIAFISTQTSFTESKMPAIELEISGLAWAIHKLQHYLDGATKIVVITDHSPLGAVLKAPSRSQRHFTPKIEKLRAYLMPYLETLEFRYKPGKLHANVDALSRLKRTDTNAIATQTSQP